MSDDTELPVVVNIPNRKDDVKDILVDLLQRITSRKFIFSVASAGIVVYLVVKGYSVEQALAAIAPLMAFVVVEGVKDIKQS
jgi:hypothetical protein